MLKPLEEMDFHPTSNKIVKILRKKTQNTGSDLYFHVLNAFFFSQMASSMRAEVVTQDRGVLPINLYACGLMTSGAGKGHSMGIMEDSIVNQFKDVFTKYTFPAIAEDAINMEANKNAAINSTDVGDELIKLEKEFASYGAMPYSFDSGTSAAFKQVRTKAQIAKAGALNFVCYTGDVEVLTTDGFKRFDTLEGNEEVAQMSMDDKREVTFLKPSRFIENDYEGKLYHFISPTGVDMSVTHNHMNVVKNTQGNLVKIAAQDTNTSHKIVNTVFAPDNGPSVLTMMDRLLIAIQADGRVRKSGIELTFKKEAKIERLRSILVCLGINFNEAIEKRGYTRFYVPLKSLNNETDYKSLPTLFPGLLKGCNLNTAKEFISELVMWDGNIRQNNLRYTNKYLSNVEFAQTIAVLAGLKTKIIHNPKKGYEGGYYVNMVRHHNGFHQIHQTTKSTSDYKGKTYCVTVPSGAIVLRRNGKTFVGGNCDEIGTNILKNEELFSVGLEAYDKGKIKQKITKNTAENARAEERDDPVPTNMMLFGTPSKLFNGGKEEQEFLSLLDTGYARRLLFGIGVKASDIKRTPEEIFDMLTDTTVDSEVKAISSYFGKLAERVNYKVQIKMPREVSILLIAYRLQCEESAERLPDYEDIKKAEMQHRFFKVLKLAAAYAFIDSVNTVSEDHLYNAIKLVEASGEAFNAILSRDKPYVKLAKYISTVDREVTFADLVEDLPFFRGSNSAKNELLQLAQAWGYKNNIIIRKYFSDGIEFLRGESLKETDLNELIVSYSQHEAYGYEPAIVPFDKFDKLACLKGYHWCNHTFLDKHRHGEKVVEGFNTVIIDVDGEFPIDSARKMLDQYSCMFYTTKRHTEEVNRYRIVIPIKYHLKLSEKDFKEFMANIFEWLPFTVDEGTNQRCKKWLSNPGQHYFNNGELLDPMQFIPKTSKNEARLKQNAELGSMDNIERWFAKEMVNGQRNNTLAKFAFMLLDSGLDPADAEQRVIDFNNKLKDKLSQDELANTVIKSLWGRARANSNV